MTIIKSLSGIVSRSRGQYSEHEHFQTMCALIIMKYDELDAEDGNVTIM